MGAYLDELEWRFNNRKNPNLFRDTLSRLVNAENLLYETLASLPATTTDRLGDPVQ